MPDPDPKGLAISSHFVREAAHGVPILGCLLVAAGMAAAAEPPVLVSRATVGELADTAAGSSEPFGERAVSADGRWVVFSSTAGNLVPGVVDDNGTYDVFLRDRDSGTTTLVSHTSDDAAVAGNLFSNAAAISADGNWVLFKSLATDLVAGATDSGFGQDLFLWDRLGDSIELVTHVPGDPLEAHNEGGYGIEGLSDDGGKVLFTSAANDLVAGQVDSNGLSDLFLFDRGTGEIEIVNHAAGAATTVAAGDLGGSWLSGNGLWVTYWQDGGTNLVASSTVCSASESFLYDVAAGTNRIVSHAPGTPLVGASGGGWCGSGPYGISADGRYVLYNCGANNCAAGITEGNAGGVWDVYLYDRDSDSSVLVSHAATSMTTTANAESFFGGTISADGAYVAWVSKATNLVTGQSDSAGTDDLFVWDRVSGAVSLVTHASGSATTAANTATGWDFTSNLSADGGRFLYESNATNLVTGQTDVAATRDVFAWDRSSDTNELVSASAANPATAGDGASFTPMIGIDAAGDVAVFQSGAGDLLASESDNNGWPDLFARDLSGDSTEAISLRHEDLPAAGVGLSGWNVWESAHQSVSGDGRFVVFLSDGGNLVAGQYDRNEGGDVFLYDHSTGALTLVSHATGLPARAADGSSWAPVISEDGNWIAFESYGTDLVAGVTDANGEADVFLWERASDTTTLVSHAAGAPLTAANDVSYGPQISADGARVAYTSWATNVMAGQSDTANTDAVFVFERASEVGTLVSHSSSSSTTARDGSLWGISLDGNWVLFESTATNVVASQSDANADNDLFLYEVGTGTNLLVSRTDAGAATTGNGYAWFGRLSRDGRYVAFVSAASNLLAGQTDANANEDVFVFDRVTGTRQLVSSTTPGGSTAGNSYSSLPALSPDGRFVAFATQATDLLAGVTDAGNWEDIYRWDRLDGSRRLVSHTAGAPLTASDDGTYEPPAISDRGSAVLFMTWATPLFTGQTDVNGDSDAFRWESGTGAIELLSRIPASANETGNNFSGHARTSLRGEIAYFSSSASDFAADDNNQSDDLFVVRPTAIFSDGFEEGDDLSWD